MDNELDIIPRYIPSKDCFVVETATGVKIDDVIMITNYYIKDIVTYHYMNKYHTDDNPGVCLCYSRVLEALVKEPETFSIEGYEDEYSAQERAVLYNMKDLIIETKKTRELKSNIELILRAQDYRKKER